MPMDAETWALIKKLMAIERLSLTEIGRRVGLDRKTVRRALLAETLPVTHLSRPRSSKLDPFKGWIQDLKVKEKEVFLRIETPAGE